MKPKQHFWAWLSLSGFLQVVWVRFRPALFFIPEIVPNQLITCVHNAIGSRIEMHFLQKRPGGGGWVGFIFSLKFLDTRYMNNKMVAFGG
jgi:hypothetical protein